MRRLLLLPLFLPIAACEPSEDPDPTDLSATIAPDSQWSGGEVTIRTEAFSALTNPVVVAGDDTLDATVVDDSTWTATLPRLGSGPVDLTARGLSHDIALGTVQLVGHHDTRDILLGRRGELQPWPWNHPSGVLGTTDDNHLFTLQVSTAQVTHYPALSPGFWYTAGTSYRPTVVLVPVPGFEAESLVSWDLAAAPVELGRYRVPNSFRHVFELAPDTWMVTSHHTLFTKSSPDGVSWTPIYTEPNESTWKLFFSPAGDRATTMVNANFNGLPVFELSTGALAYHLPGLGSSQSAAFTGDGDRLYVLAGASPGAPVELARIDPDAGSSVASTPVSDLPALAVGVDPDGRRVYVPVLSADSVLTLRVYDGETLESIAELEVPGHQPVGCITCYHGGVVMPGLAGGEVYFVSESWPYDGRTRVIRWDLLD